LILFMIKKGSTSCCWWFTCFCWNWIKKGKAKSL